MKEKNDKACGFTTVGIKKFSRKHCKTGTASYKLQGQWLFFGVSVLFIGIGQALGSLV